MLRTARRRCAAPASTMSSAMHAVLTDAAGDDLLVGGRRHPDLEATRAWLDSMIATTPRTGRRFHHRSRRNGDRQDRCLATAGDGLHPGLRAIGERAMRREALRAFLDHVFARPDVDPSDRRRRPAQRRLAAAARPPHKFDRDCTGPRGPGPRISASATASICASTATTGSGRDRGSSSDQADPAAGMALEPAGELELEQHRLDDRRRQARLADELVDRRPASGRAGRRRRRRSASSASAGAARRGIARLGLAERAEMRAG